MIRISALSTLVLLAACSGGDADPETPEPSTSTTTTDTGTPPDTVEPGPPVEGLTVVKHADHENILVVSWTQVDAAEAWVEYSFDEGVWHETPHVDAAAGSAQQQLLLGIPYATRVWWRLVNETAEGRIATVDEKIRSGPLPDGVPEPLLVYADAEGYDADFPYVFTAIARLSGGNDPSWSFIIDRQARVVWARQSASRRTHMHPHPSWDGTALLIDQNSFWGAFDGGAGSTIEKVKIDGSVVQEWAVPGLHHPFTELPDGSLAWGAFEDFWQGDETIEITRPDGRTETLWSCYEWYAQAGDEGHDCGSNTLRYDVFSDTFLFSFYTVETVVQIDASTGASLRWFGQLNGSWAFDPPESHFWYQHGAYFTDDRTLVLSTHDQESAQELVVREYALDEDERTLREVWNFGVGLGVLGPQMGEVTLLPSGNVHHNYGELPRIREGTREGEVVWDVSWRSGNLARSTPIRDLYAFAP